MDTPSRAAAALGVDFGTHHTVATVLRGDGRRHQLLFEGTPLLPSGIYLDIDTTILVGRDAAREGRLRPERYERNPKLRLDAPAILLGDREVPVRDAVAAVLRRAIAECGTVAGPPLSVTVTVPAGWGPARRHVIGDAAAAAGAASPVLLPEPVAAARYFTEVLGRDLALGQALVVFDLGAGTFDVSAVTRTAAGHEVLAVDGSDRIGGHYLDQAVVDHLGGRFTGDRAERWRSLLDPDAGSERLRRRFALYDEVREAKERLSRGTATEIVVPGFANEELLTRAELELLSRPLLMRAVAITRAVIREAGLAPERVAGVFMVGGASRMPLAATMIHQELGIAPTLIEQPELVVGEGAVVAAPPLAPSSPPLTPAPIPLAQPYTPAAALPVAAPEAVPGAAAAPPTGLLPPAAPPTGSPPPAARPNRSFRGLAGIVAVAVVVLLGAGWFVGDLVGRFQERAPDDPETASAASSPSASEEAAGLFEGETVTDWADVAIVDVRTTATSVTVVTNADAALKGCTVDYAGGGRREELLDVPCGGFTVDGLWASDAYEFELYAKGRYLAPLAGTADTATVTGEVYWNCPQAREYCREQGGEPGIRGEADDPESAIGYAEVGEVFALNCYEAAELITPRGEEEQGFWDYHPGKDASDLMVQVELGGGVGYLPFVWLIVDPGDLNGLGGLGPC